VFLILATPVGGDASMDFWSMVLPGEFADPVDFPCFAAVGGEGLLHAGGGWGEIEPDVADEDGAARPLLLMVELAAWSDEGSDDGWGVDGAGIEVDEVDAPLVGGGVVHAERLRLDVEFLVSAGDVELLEVGVAVEEFVVVGDAVVDDPGVGVVEAIGEAADVDFPVANEEVEVMGAVALGELRGVGGGGWLRAELGDWDCGEEGEGEKAEPERAHGSRLGLIAGGLSRECCGTDSPPGLPV
jgi:hypothetical protein